MQSIQPKLLQEPWIREAYPVLQEVTYLNVGTYGIMPEPALHQFLEYVADFERRGVASTSGWGKKNEETRERLAALIGAQPTELSFTRNATDGINLVLAGIDWQPGDEVITCDQEHEAMMHPLMILHQTRGLVVRVVSVCEDETLFMERLEALRSPRTRLVALSLVTCETGTRLPGTAITAWAQQHGIATLFDGAQASAALPVDVRQLDCDYYASNGHKWMSGPKGCGFFYCKAEKRDSLLPAHVGAGSLKAVDLQAQTAELFDTGQRFEFGTRAWPIYAGLGASLDWYDRIGWGKVYGHIAALSDYLKQEILRRPFLGLLTPLSYAHSSGLVTFTVKDQQVSEIRKIISGDWRITIRLIPHYNAIRISTAHFNQPADIDRLMACLESIVG